MNELLHELSGWHISAVGWSIIWLSRSIRMSLLIGESMWMDNALLSGHTVTSDKIQNVWKVTKLGQAVIHPRISVSSSVWWRDKAAWPLTHQHKVTNEIQLEEDVTHHVATYKLRFRLLRGLEIVTYLKLQIPPCGFAWADWWRVLGRTELSEVLTFGAGADWSISELSSQSLPAERHSAYGSLKTDSTRAWLDLLVVTGCIRTQMQHTRLHGSLAFIRNFPEQQGELN